MAALLSEVPSPAAWRVRLDASRSPSAHAQHAPPVASARLQRRFREITTRTRSLLKQPLESPALQELCAQALQLSQLALEELNRLQAGTDAAAESVVAELLDQNWRLLCTLDSQQRLLADCRALAVPLQSWIAACLEAGQHGALRWADTMADWWEALSPAEDAAWCPLAGVDVVEAVAAAGVEHPQHCAQALLTARLVSAAADRLLEFDPRGPALLFAAALVQDIGWWCVDGPRASANQMTRLHPQRGAALLAGIPDCPSEVVLLVTAHHELVGGLGRPPSPGFARRCHAFALLVRWTELVLEPRCHRDAAQRGDSLAFSAALELWRDVRYRRWDEPLARKLLDLMEPGLTARVEQAFARGLWSPGDRQRARPSRDDSRSTATARDLSAPPAPNFLRLQRDGGRRGVLPAARMQRETPP
uniref:HD domain-containing protein n=1 Tax=Schlesneria paludicola TaxID=360056 RepID=A0A7C4QS04_9PLAN